MDYLGARSQLPLLDIESSEGQITAKHVLDLARLV